MNCEKIRETRFILSFFSFNKDGCLSVKDWFESRDAYYSSLFCLKESIKPLKNVSVQKILKYFNYYKYFNLILFLYQYVYFCKSLDST